MGYGIELNIVGSSRENTIANSYLSLYCCLIEGFPGIIPSVLDQVRVLSRRDVRLPGNEETRVNRSEIQNNRR